MMDPFVTFFSECSDTSDTTKCRFFIETLEEDDVKGEDSIKTTTIEEDFKNKIEDGDINSNIQGKITLENEYEIINKYVHTVLKNKEKQELYEFKKYFVDKNLFRVFVQLFLHLIKNKEDIKNPCKYISDYFKEDPNKKEDAEKKKLIEENEYYKKKNQELHKEIDLLELQIRSYSIKRNCNYITKIIFNQNEPMNAVQMFQVITNNNSSIKESVEKKIKHFMFTKDTCMLFLEYLDDSKRNKLYSIFWNRTDTSNFPEEDESFYQDLLKKIYSFIKFYSSFEKYKL